MLWYCLKCRKKRVKSQVLQRKIGKPMLLSKRAVFDGKKSRFIKEQEASRLITNLLGVKSPFEEVPILGSII